VTLAIRPAHSALLHSIREAPGSPRVVVIGAVAVGHHIPLARETGDVDLAIVAEEAVVEAILIGADWVRERGATQRWRHEESESIVDVLPATSRILRDGRLRFDGDGRELSMVGFDLALSHTVNVSIDDGPHCVEVATRPALVMMKTVAWLDRPYERTRDLGDIARILDYSLDDWDQRRWEEPLDVVESEEQSAFFAGRELGAIIGDHHRSKIEEFFERMETEAWLAVMARGARWVGVDLEGMARRRLAAFRRGLGL
jgi:predicted nucleotidyltransferase